jgi:hypothetical protein
VGDDEWLQEVEEAILHGKEILSRWKSADELFAALSATLIQIGEDQKSAFHCLDSDFE